MGLTECARWSALTRMISTTTAAAFGLPVPSHDGSKLVDDEDNEAPHGELASCASEGHR